MDEPSAIEALLRFTNVYFAYEPKAAKRKHQHALGHPQPCLRNVSLEVNQGEFLALTGASGSGKTTLARIAAGRLATTSGRVEWSGALSFMPQQAQTTINPRMTAWAAITEPLATLKLPAASIEELMISASNDAGLSSRLFHRRAAHLSGGELRKLALARALITRPPLLILDEPLVGIDLHSQAEILEIIHRLCGAGNTAALVISHDILAAGRYADRLAVMDNGEIVESGRAMTVIDAPKHPVTAALLASIPGGRRKR